MYVFLKINPPSYHTQKLIQTRAQATCKAKAPRIKRGGGGGGGIFETLEL